MFKLGDLMTLKRGYDLPNSKRKTGNVPIVSSSGITGYHSIFKVEGPGVITGRYGTLGEVFYVTENFWPLNTALYIKDMKGNNPRYLSYLLKNFLSGMKSEKAAVPGVNRNDLHARFVAATTNHNTQQKIASILSHYDDLIENNRRRIQLLEEAARVLYKEWFVHLRFPGHEHTRINDGVPEEWEKCTAIDVLDVMSGGTPKTNNSEYWDGDIPFFTPKDATDSIYVLSTEKTLSDKGLKTCNSKFYPRNTLFITARGTVGRINLAQKSMAMNQSCYALKAKAPLNQFFMYCALKASISQFTSRASGAVFDAIVVDTFKLIPFLKPAKSIIDLFTEIIEPIFTQIETLLLQNQKLAQARDLLLPKLMNGEIEV